VHVQSEIPSVTKLILRRFELGEFFLSASHVGFLRAAETKELLLPA
jgi:hypothetical protein